MYTEASGVQWGRETKEFVFFRAEKGGDSGGDFTGTRR